MGHTVMDSCNRIYHGVENEEIYLWVVSEFVEDARVGRKCSAKKFVVATSTIDVGQTDWRLAKPIVLLE